LAILRKLALIQIKPCLKTRLGEISIQTLVSGHILKETGPSVYLGDSTGFWLDSEAEGELTESRSSCYIYKVPRVQFSLTVVSCNVFFAR